MVIVLKVKKNILLHFLNLISYICYYYFVGLIFFYMNNTQTMLKVNLIFNGNFI